MKAKFRAVDIADFYIQLANSIPDDTIDNLKINKLLYYAQGASMAILHRPIFSDDIQAWDYGPVVPEVYKAFKCCGRNIIEEPQERFDEGRLAPEEMNLLLDVYAQYSRFTGLALKSMSHASGSPWHQVYRQGANAVIPLALLEKYFSSREQLSQFTVAADKIPIITKVPAEWDSAEDDVYGTV